MTVLEAAAKVLSELGHPLPTRELTSLMLSKGYWQTQGLTPEATVQACLSVDIKTKGESSLFIRSKPGHYGLKGQAVTEPSSTPLGASRPLFDEEEEVDTSEVQSAMTFTDAAERLLQEVGKPMHYRDLTRIVQERGWLSSRGKTPEATMYAQILTEIGRYEKRHALPRFRKLGHGEVGLEVWESGSHPPVELPWTSEDENRLAKLKSITPVQFEKLTSLLLTQIFDAEIPETPRSNDAGIDARGMVRLHDLIEVEVVAQAKRFDGHNVHRPDIQRLRGSMGPQAIGVFITTEDFSPGAKNEARRPSAMQPIGLINGRTLVGLLKETTIELAPNGDPVLMDDGENVLAPTTLLT
jgi:restriction system protein